MVINTYQEEARGQWDVDTRTIHYMQPGKRALLQHTPGKHRNSTATTEFHRWEQQILQPWWESLQQNHPQAGFVCCLHCVLHWLKDSFVTSPSWKTSIHVCENSTHIMVSQGKCFKVWLILAEGNNEIGIFFDVWYRVGVYFCNCNLIH